MSAESPKVHDVVLRLPKTLPPTTTVDHARTALADDHVHMLLLTEDGRLLGTLVRDDLAEVADPSSPAINYAVVDGRTIPATLPAEEARQLLIARGERRRVVVDEHDQVVGLLCLNRARTGFCSDADVAARAADLLVSRPEGSLR